MSLVISLFHIQYSVLNFLSYELTCIYPAVLNALKVYTKLMLHMLAAQNYLSNYPIIYTCKWIKWSYSSSLNPDFFMLFLMRARETEVHETVHGRVMSDLIKSEQETHPLIITAERRASTYNRPAELPYVTALTLHFPLGRIQTHTCTQHKHISVTKHFCN